MCPINATCSAEEDALTRMTSTSIRHGADIHMVVQQLEKVRGEMTCLAKSMARALKKYIPDGTVAKEAICPECSNEGTLMYKEGCLICSSCGYSKCG